MTTPTTPPLPSRCCALCGRRAYSKEDRCKGCGFLICATCDRRVAMRPDHGLHEHSIEEIDVVDE